MNQRNLELMVALRRELHAHPELSNQESQTKQRLMSFLAEHTSLELIDRGKWFCAVYDAGDGASRIAFRAELDASAAPESIDLPYASSVPGVAHKCGHDGHCAALAAFALEIDRTGSEKTIFFLFQHAKETGDGAAECAAFLKEMGVNEIYSFHNMSGLPLNTVAVRAGGISRSSKKMTIQFKRPPEPSGENPEPGEAPEPGDGLGAGRNPEPGRTPASGGGLEPGEILAHNERPGFDEELVHNESLGSDTSPSFAAAKLLDAISDLTAKEKNTGVVLCTVERVSTDEPSCGDSPDSSTVWLTLQAEFEEERNQLQENLEALSVVFAYLFDLQCSFSYSGEFPETFNHGISVLKVLKACHRAGISAILPDEPFSSSEDFGSYLKDLSGAIFYIGNGEHYPHVHTPQFDFNDEILETAVELFRGLASLS